MTERLEESHLLRYSRTALARDNFVLSTDCGYFFVHWGPGVNCPCCPPLRRHWCGPCCFLRVLLYYTGTDSLLCKCSYCMQRPCQLCMSIPSSFLLLLSATQIPSENHTLMKIISLNLFSPHFSLILQIPPII